MASTDERTAGGVKLIAITGPESTGKTTLAAKLAEKLNTVWVPEFAREYLDKLNRNYTAADLVYIARKQIEAEADLISRANGFLICDTDIAVIKIWHQEVFNSENEEIEQLFLSHNYHLHLLMKPDLPWQWDPQRENPFDRGRLFNIYKEILSSAGKNTITIEGVNEARLRNAHNATLNFFSN